MSKALKDKLYEKEYTDKYREELAIFCFGTKQSTRTLIERIKEMIQKDKVLKNDFTKVHFIIYDFLFDNETGISMLSGKDTLTFIDDFKNSI